MLTPPLPLLIGFTGTRKGLTAEQRQELTRLLATAQAGSALHHGDCIGADAEAYLLATRLGLFTISHPPTVQTFRAFTPSTEERVPQQYSIRNANIVRESMHLIACPKERDFSRKGGTWQTVRLALHRRPTTIIYSTGMIQFWPVGEIQQEP